MKMAFLALFFLSLSMAGCCQGGAPLSSAEAQLYRIESFEGGIAKISLKYTLFSKRLRVYALNDSLFLSEFTGIREVHVLHKRFLQIVYGITGGSGLDLRNTVILSVRKNKINVAMLVTSYAEAVTPDQHNLCKLKFTMIGIKKDDYKLVVDTHDEQTSKLHPQANYNKRRQVTLIYDPSQDIFTARPETIFP